MLRPRMFLAVWCLMCIPALALAQVRREIQFPDIPGYKTLKCDFHMHTVFSDGTVWPTTRVDEAWREGLDVISITDHIEVQPHRNDVPTNHGRSHEIALGYANARNILLVPGVEITRDTPPGHFNAIFIKDAKALDTPDLDEVFARAVEQGAFIFWNHPGWQGPERGQWGEMQTKLYEKKWLHAIEVCNGDIYYGDAHKYATEKNLPIVGNSDVHYPMTDLPYTPEKHRTMTLVFARKRNLDSIREAMDAGRTAAWLKNMIVGNNKKCLTALFNACVNIRPIHSRAGNAYMLEIHNRCELNLELEPAPNQAAPQIALPALSTSLVRIPPQTLDSREFVLAYRVKNILVGPGQPLEVNLRISNPLTTQPATTSKAASTPQ